MTIRIYPSRLESEPLETHETRERLTIAEWMQSVAPDFDINATELHPTVRVNGSIVESGEWPLTYFSPSDDVDVYIEAKGIEVAIVAAVVLAVVAVAIAMSMKAATPQTRKQGKAIEDAGALANQVKWGDPIPEIAGAPRTFPNYIAPPRRYFIEQRQQWVDSLVCIGAGEYLLDRSQVFVGDTSAPTLGDNLEVRFFEPGETIPAPYNEWWHTPEEVGFTSLGGAGMTLGPATNIARYWGASFTFTGSSVTGNAAPPASWSAGLFVSIEAEHELIFSGNTVQSELLDTLQLATGDEFELSGERAGVYTISAIYAGTGGSTGAPATATGSQPPNRYDFGAEHASLVIGINNNQYSISLTSDAADLNDLIASINSQLNGTPVRARAAGSTLELYQLEPYTGSSLSLTGDVATLLGAPVITQGAATTSPVGTRYAVSGVDFGAGSEVAAAGLPDFLYTITNINGSTITVSPSDVEFWTGFPAGVSGATSSVQVDGGSLEGGWSGPFAATPIGEKSDAFEVDIAFPGGLIHYDKKGRTEAITVDWYVRWRYIGDQDWNTVSRSTRAATEDHIGITLRVDLPQDGRVEVSVRRGRILGWKNISEKIQWSGLRSRIVGAPTSYPDMTVAHVRLRSGDKVSGAVENKLSIRAMRKLPTIEDPDVIAPTRDIAPYFVHMMSTVGYGRDLIDMAHIEALHAIWSDRGDTFDLSVDGSSTLKTVANYCLQAGFAELTLRNGKISAARDAYRMGSPPRVYSPQEMTAPLIETTQTIMPDDIDGVDVEYVDYLTGRTLTESYRLIGDEGLRVEKIQAVGVTGRTQAWRLAARRRRIAAYRRTAYKFSTELSGMNSFYMDYVGLQDGIPEWGQSAFVIDHNGNEITLSEEILGTGSDPVAMIRKPDGTATAPIPIAVSGSTITLAAMPPDVSLTSDPNHPTVIYIGNRQQIVHNALVTQVQPSGDSRVELQAVNMDNRVYVEDDMGPDQIILTSRLYPIAFSDGIAPSFAGAEVREIPVPNSDDAVGVGLLAPAIFRRTAVRYLTYSAAEPEALNVGLLAPAISRKTEVRHLTYSNAEPEELQVGLVAPSISRKKVADYFDYIIPEETITVGLVTPTIKRTNT